MEKKCVIVHYDGDDYNRAIEQELKRLGLKHGETAVVALPKSLWKWGKSVPMRCGHTSRNLISKPR